MTWAVAMHRVDYENLLKELRQGLELNPVAASQIQVVDDVVVEERIWPKSKKKRIRKKWAKDPSKVRRRVVKAYPQPGKAIQMHMEVARFWASKPPVFAPPPPADPPSFSSLLWMPRFGIKPWGG